MQIGETNLRSYWIKPQKTSILRRTRSNIRRHIWSHFGICINPYSTVLQLCTYSTVINNLCKTSFKSNVQL